MRSAVTAGAVASHALLVAGCGSSAAHPRSVPGRPGAALLYAEYPALGLSQPSGITVVEPPEAHAYAARATRPLWVNQPAGDPRIALPEISSAREVSHRGSARIWIARSTRGGICVLSFRPELAGDAAPYHSIGASCGTPGGLTRGAAQFERGAGPHADWLVSGVAPRGVVAVTLRLVGGGARTVPVQRNSYSVAVARPVAGLALVRSGMRH
jgi:hypothetical protein